MGGPYESTPISGYDRSAVHHMRLVVNALNVSIYVDRAVTPVFTYVMSRVMFKAGYISLISVNNDCEFSNLKIRELPIAQLPDDPKPAPVPDAATRDSLDTLAAREVDAPSEFNELEGLTQTMKRP